MKGLSNYAEGISVRADFLDSRKDFQSVKLAWSVLDLELKTHILTPLKGNNQAQNEYTQYSKIYVQK